MPGPLPLLVGGGCSREGLALLCALVVQKGSIAKGSGAKDSIASAGETGVFHHGGISFVCCLVDFLH